MLRNSKVSKALGFWIEREKKIGRDSIINQAKPYRSRQ